VHVHDCHEILQYSKEVRSYVRAEAHLECVLDTGNCQVSIFFVVLFAFCLDTPKECKQECT